MENNDFNNYLGSLLHLLRTNENDERIYRIPSGPFHRAGYGMDEELLFVLTSTEAEPQLYNERTKEYTAVSTLSDTAQDILTMWLADAHQILTSLPSIDPEPSADKIMWEMEPVEITSEDKTPIGLVGIAVREVVGDKKMLAPIFIASDGSWAHLTMYAAGNREEMIQALADLGAINIALGGISKAILKNVPAYNAMAKANEVAEQKGGA